MPTPPNADRGSASSGRLPRSADPEPDRLDPTDEAFVLDAPSSRSGLRRRGVALGAVVATVVLASGAVVGVRASGAEPGTNLRTATVATRSVAQTIDAVATVEPVTQASIAFPVGGTVASVAVADGDTVTTGQVLATLDPASLQASVNTANATLAEAQLSLHQALNGETVTGTSMGAAGGSGSGSVATGATSGASTTSTPGVSASTTGSGTSGSGTSGSGSAGSGSGSSAEIVAAQQSVVAAQAGVDRGLVEAEKAMANANLVCTALGSSTPTPAASTPAPAGSTTQPSQTGPSGKPDGQATAVPTTTYTTTVASASTATDATTLTDCQTALGQVLTAQQALADQQGALDRSVQTLTALLDTSANAAGSSAAVPSATPSSGTSASTNASAATPTTTTTATAAELVAYQKAVDAAGIGVAVAEQALEQATIVSPVDGTVVSLGLEVGDTVTAASTTATVVVAGGDGYELTTAVAVTDLPDIEVGQAVTIRPDSASTDLAGQVVRVGVTPSATSTTSYPVTIGVAGDTTGLRNGSTASVTIVTDEETDAIAVPVSAVTVDGSRSTVSVLADGRTSQVQVEVGAVGSSWIAVTNGVTVGQIVVLADIDQALPGSATDGSAATTTGRTGAFPGGGTFAGGRPPG